MFAACRCGEVKLEVVGAPIVTVACHCGSCQEAAARFSKLGAPSLLDDDGGTPAVLVRKDRVTTVSGHDQLRAYRLEPRSDTRRTLARCCNTPLFIDPGTPWLSFFRERLGPDAPPVEVRMSFTSKSPPSDGLPVAKSISLAVMWRITRAWAAMGFRTPKREPIEEAPYPDP